MQDELLSKNFLRPDEVARMFGLSRSFVYRLIQRGEIQAVHFGKTLRISRAEVDRKSSDLSKKSVSQHTV